jgi:hypothetical protein
MTAYPTKFCTAFTDTRRIASGEVSDVAAAVKAVMDAGDSSAILVFDDETAQPIELDLRGSAHDVAARHSASPTSAELAGRAEEAARAAGQQPAAPRAVGRPKLGVVGREVTLLPRHWEWLAAQPGGASVTLRKLVEQARKQGSAAERARTARDTTYRFAVVMAGNEPGFEEAMRSLYAGYAPGFEANIATWPVDVRDYARKLATDAFPQEGE